MKRFSLILFFLLALTATELMHAQTTLPWSEDFEGYTTTTLGNEWATPATYDGKPCVLLTNPYASPSGQNSLECRTNSSNSNIFVFPQFNKPLDLLVVSFTLAGHADGRGQFGYITNANDASTFQSLTDISQPSTAGNTFPLNTSLYTYYEYDLSTMDGAPHNASYRLAVKYTFVGSGEDSWYFDDFRVTNAGIRLNQNLTMALADGVTYTFYDSGGAFGNYGDNEYYTATFTYNGDITIEFSEFQTIWGRDCDEMDYDYMYIYDGTTSGAQLARGQSGCPTANLTINTPYTATSGTMTIDWNTSRTSSASSDSKGWKATITTRKWYITEIATVANWEEFCNAVNGGHDYSGETVTMTADITTAVTTKVGTFAGRPFCGTFDGQGHTLTVDLPSIDQAGNAPFMHIEGATIQNLIVNGTVTAGNGDSNRHAAGLVGYAWSGTNTIRNCQVNTNVNSNSDYAGGIIGHGRGSNIIMEGCAYTGTITAVGTNPVGGLIGWSDYLSGLTITDCFFAGTYSNADEDALFHPIGCTDHATTNTRTITNTYYTVDPRNMDATIQTLVYELPNKGKHAYSITGQDPVTVAMNGSATATYSASGITAYSTGIKYNNVLYAGDGDLVSLALSGSGTGSYLSDHGTLTDNGSSHTLAMEAYDTQITASECYAPTNLSFGEAPLTWDEGDEITLTWDGEDESYIVELGTPGTTTETQEIFDQDFENGLSSWTFISMNDANDLGDHPDVLFTAGIVNSSHTSHDGSNCFMFSSWNVASDYNQYLISPQLTLTGASTLGFFFKKAYDEYTESLQVGYSTSTNELDAFTWTDVDDLTDYWQSDLLNLTSDVKYIAFHYYGNNSRFVYLDDISISGPVTVPTITWNIVADNVTSPYTFLGLTPGTPYMVRVKSHCGQVSDVITTPGVCPTPTELSVTNLKSTSATLNWEGEAASYNVRYRQQVGDWINISSDTNSLEITGLAQETAYEFKVQSLCYAEYPSEWSAISSFTTPYGCDTPTELSTEVTGNNQLSWTGCNETYNLQYREFDPSVTIILTIGNIILGDGSGYQMLLDADATAYGTIIPEEGPLNEGDASAETYDAFEYKIPTNADGALNTTNIVGYNSSVRIQIPAGIYDWCITNPVPDGDIFIASDQGNVNGRQDNYVFEAGATYEFTVNRVELYDCVDVTITGNENPWTIVEDVTNPYTLPSLTAQTTYQYKVQGVNCDGNGSTTEWSEAAVFTMPSFYTKHIDPYTTDGGYYLIASPIGQVDPAKVGGMLDNEFDLYYFDNTEDLEWRNYKANAFVLTPGKGYLYANSGNNGVGIDLVFAGTANTEINEVTLQLSSFTEFEGMNLVGNPFAVEAYIDRDFYRLAEGGAEVMADASNGAIQPMEGVFVYADEYEETMIFSTENNNDKAAGLALNLTQGRGTIIDRAVVRFGEGRQLPKFQLRKNSTKLYIPQNGKDYAVVNVGGDVARYVSTIPVYFKTEKNGTYSLSLNSENVAFSYLHLIDNLTGNDIDLLVTPSYTFEAKTTDYESRFKLVFVCGDANDDNDFAFNSNGSWIISNEGSSTLQVIDLNGRILSSETVNGSVSKAINVAPGVYVIRLISGNDVKVQKVVVR